MPHARFRLGREQVARRRLEEMHHRIVVPIGSVGHVDDDLCTFEDFGEPLAGECVDARVGGRWDRLVSVLIELGDEP